ncbi:spore coat protein U domain-containing protein [Ramlibacter sp. AN1133]|uniref:spore coat protein U domain-containing protein n=1 Tax=Ramlibacter sp. AN1133 TaxID=3133429 RepID=UPI0030C5824C
MKTVWLRILPALLALLVLPGAARAAITCTSLASPGVSINYQPNTLATLQAVFAVTCTRNTGDPTSVSYSVKADNGGNPSGVNNKATHASGSTIRYDFFTASTCGTQWKGGMTVSDTITWPAGATGPITKQTSFWACIVSAQAAPSSGVYADSVGLTLTYGGNQTLPGTVAVNIYAPALCTVTSPPGNISLSYAAFGAQVAGSTTIGVNCTSGMPYTLGTDVPEGVLNGLRYVLSLSATAPNGIGAPQTHTVTATIPAGQAGTCPSGSCNATRTHTLTITY